MLVGLCLWTIRRRIDKLSEDYLLDIIYKNAMFPFLLTRALLPTLRNAPGPVQVIFIGSTSGDLPLPCLIPYGASKAFLKNLSTSIHAHEHFLSTSNVEMMYMNVGNVAADWRQASASLFMPSPETFVKWAVPRIGCGRRVVSPHLPHACQLWSTGFAPAWIVDGVVKDTMLEEFRKVKN